MWIRRHVPMFAPDTGGGSAGAGAGAGGGGAGAAGAGAGGGGGGQPWHSGIEPETIGWLQNQGHDLADPKAFATKITQQYRELQKFTGVPADRLLKLPEANDLAGWKGVHSRLGVPAEAKDYDLAGIKRADGAELDPAFSDMMRVSLHKANVAKDRAGDVVKDVIKHLDDARAKESADYQAKLDQARANVAKNWGNNAGLNKEIAKQGAAKLGWTEEEFNSLEKAVGYERFMDTMLKIGMSMKEGDFVEGGRGGVPITTMEGAKSKLAELQRDEAWGKRLLSGDAATVQEFNRLTIQSLGLTMQDLSAA